jgi:hypothetical protein
MMWLRFAVVILACASALAQSPAPMPLAPAQPTSAGTLPQGRRPLPEIAISPSRLELEMLPGTEKTVVVNMVYGMPQEEGKSFRVLASLEDFLVTPEGEVRFVKTTSNPRSAISWVNYSPVETVMLAGKTHPIRVTVSVPKDATPGDHTFALIVEPRMDPKKLQPGQKEVTVRFRMSCVVYVMVPQLTRVAVLEDLLAEQDGSKIVVTPRLRNDGDSHTRPTQSVKIYDGSGALVAESADAEALPLLAGSTLAPRILIEKQLQPGTYSVQYRVFFEDPTKVLEGRTELIIEPAQPKPVAGKAN